MAMPPPLPDELWWTILMALPTGRDVARAAFLCPGAARMCRRMWAVRGMFFTGKLGAPPQRYAAIVAPGGDGTQLARAVARCPAGSAILVRGAQGDNGGANIRFERRVSLFGEDGASVAATLFVPSAATYPPEQAVPFGDNEVCLVRLALGRVLSPAALRIRGCTLRGVTSYGAWSSARITQCTFRHGADHAVHFAGYALIVERCIFEGASQAEPRAVGIAVTFTHGGGVTVANNTFRDEWSALKIDAQFRDALHFGPNEYDRCAHKILSDV